MRWTRSDTRSVAAVLAFVASSALADDRDRFVFELDGVPFGIVELELTGEQYRYTSTHFFPGGGDRARSGVRSATFRLADSVRDGASGDRLESLWLWRRPRLGCERVRSELEGRVDLACVRSVIGDTVHGTVGAEAFRADYVDGRLSTLVLGRATFSRVDGAAVPPSPPTLLAEGWPIDGRQGQLVLHGFPTAASSASDDALPLWKSGSSARALAREVRRQFEDDPGSTCVDQVRAFAEASSRKRLGGVLIVHGLVAEPGAARAFPHVWIRVPVAGAWLDLDPAFGGDVTRQTHVPLVAVPAGDRSGVAGRVWLSFTGSRVRVARSSGSGSAAEGRQRDELSDPGKTPPEITGRSR